LDLSGWGGAIGYDGGGKATAPSAGIDVVPRTALMKPDATIDAPDRMKHPKITCIPRRTSILPLSKRNPTEETAITATVIASDPSNVALIH
jgi:hypothetical protein